MLIARPTEFRQERRLEGEGRRKGARESGRKEEREMGREKGEDGEISGHNMGNDNKSSQHVHTQLWTDLLPAVDG